MYGRTMRFLPSLSFLLLWKSACGFSHEGLVLELRQTALRAATSTISFPATVDTHTQSTISGLEDDSPYSLSLRNDNLVIEQDETVLLGGLSPNTWHPVWRSQQDDVILKTSIMLSASHEYEFSLGKLVSCNRILANARLNRYWMGPAFGKNVRDVPYDTQFLLVEVRENGPYAVILPLVDAGFRASLFHSDGNLMLTCHSESGDTQAYAKDMKAVYIGIGEDPFRLLKTSFRRVAKEIGSFKTLDEKKIPDSVNDFGWCTWDAFYSKVTPEGVLQGVASLKDIGVPPRTLILDDGWQQVDPAPPAWRPFVEENATIFSKVGNVLVSAIAKVVENFYEKCVRKAPHGSLGNVIWRFVSKNILSRQLWEYFDRETDFGRQLSGFPPNQKFQMDDGTPTSGKDGINTLKNLVCRLKSQLGMKRVYCWHALHGYWRGLSQALGESIGIAVQEVRPLPSNHMLRIEPQLAWDTVSLFGVGLVTTEKDLATFYKHVHAPLKEAGVDGVKVDVQSGVSAVGGGISGGPHLARIYTEAMEASVSEHFSSDGAAECINCMCHSTENIYRYRKTAVARASDDFYPDRPHSHTVHLVNVAYNSLFLGEICLPDWDMFHSNHQSAGLHAAGRAIAGSPVYVSDAPGNHDADLLRKLVLPDGSILRALLPGRPTRDCLFADIGTDGETALKVWNQNKFGGVVGAFNVQGVAWNFETHENEIVKSSPSPVQIFVKPFDVESLQHERGPFAVWRHREEKLNLLPTGNSFVKSNLSHREWEIFTISPVMNLVLSPSTTVEWSPIGLGNMMNSGGAIQGASSLQKETTRSASVARAHVSVRGPGQFVAYARPQPSRILVNEDAVSYNDFSYVKPTGELSLDLPREKEEGGFHQVTVEWEEP